jgi:hypothetical protein
MTFKPSQDLKDYLQESAIMSYRLVDGSYVIAEEVDYEEGSNIIYISGALELDRKNTDGKIYLKPWMATEEEEMIIISADKIIGRSDTPLHLKVHYHKYFIIEKLHNHLSKGEMEEVMNLMFNPQVDNQGLTEEEEEYEDETESWKVDNGISDSNDLNSISDIHSEWRKKYKGNN